MEFKTIDELEEIGFKGFIQVSQLINNSCSEVPERKGVYFVLNLDKQCEFLHKSVGGWHSGRNPTVDIKELHNSWVDDTIVLYIGKAGGGNTKATLKKRLKQYMRFGQGKSSPHHGGRYIWQLKNNGDLVVSWKVLYDDDPKDIETGYILEFKRKYSKYPFANLQK